MFISITLILQKLYKLNQTFSLQTKSSTMIAICLFVLVFIVAVQPSTISMLTDDESKNVTNLILDTLDSNNVDIFNQLLNQETIIRMTLVKNVHALMKDMLTIQEKFITVENRISRIQTSTDNEIFKLKEEVKLLKTENEFLKNNSVFLKAELAHLNENLTDFSNTLTDVKIEVRYLSITLFDINAHLRETAEILQLYNVSIDNIKSDISDNERKQSATLLEQDTQHMRVIGKCVRFSRDINYETESKVFKRT